MAAVKKAAKEEKKLGGYREKLNAVNKERQVRIADALQGEFEADCGDPSLQWATGGYIRGRCNLVWGPSKSGKSTLVLKWAGQEQKKRGDDSYVIIFDSEFNYDENNPSSMARLAACGIDPSRVLISHGNTMDELFMGIHDLKEDIKKSFDSSTKNPLKVAAVVVDSWGGVGVESAIKNITEGTISDAGNSYGGNAKFIGPLINYFLGLAGQYGVTCFFVQHCMDNLEMYGKKYKLIGGHKLRFLVHFSLFMETIEAKESTMDASGHIIGQKEADDYVAVGKKIRAYCDKSRKVLEGRKVEFWFDFESVKFAKSQQSLFDLAVKLEVIGHPEEIEVDKKGKPILGEDGKPKSKIKTTSYCFPADNTQPGCIQWHGKPKTLDALSEKTLYDRVFAACMDAHKKNATADATNYEDLLSPDEAEAQEAKE
jgi:RecA/RadA recombinase